VSFRSLGAALPPIPRPLFTSERPSARSDDTLAHISEQTMSITPLVQKATASSGCQTKSCLTYVDSIAFIYVFSTMPRPQKACKMGKVCEYYGSSARRARGPASWRCMALVGGSVSVIVRDSAPICPPATARTSCRFRTAIAMSSPWARWDLQRSLAITGSRRACPAGPGAASDNRKRHEGRWCPRDRQRRLGL
jgi:hypothetical protein